MRVLVVGSGAREHALCWAIAASPLVDRLYAAPGNAGIANEAICVPIGVGDLDGLVTFAKTGDIDFVVIGPEAPLVAGLADRMAAVGIKTFGPSAAAAALEGSKSFTKELCRANDIPTAAYERFTDLGAAEAYVRRKGAPIVIKADGLTAGKGVVVAATVEEAIDALRAMLGAKRFGAAGASLVVEEFLEGEEASFHALIDGTNVLALASAQDHKRVGDGDVGPNTGGMGSYSPAPVVSERVAEAIMTRIIKPTVSAMAAMGRPFKGVLYAGVMVTAQGPKLIEYNVRFGDPEAQVLIPRLQSDLLPALVAAADGELKQFQLRWHDRAALCVVMAAKGYPEAPQRGTEIRGLDDAAALPDVIVFHAGTKEVGGRILADGGRVLGVTALGTDVAEAQRNAYAAVDRIDWPGGFCRRDIGWRAIKR
ncbi:MAG: phosphoribosylamine--glycine ligase [Proteobacteria bacterium]|nr:phosphoribosylamine--glycine ligase [Pseudomonadota bacterium]